MNKNKNIVVLSINLSQDSGAAILIDGVVIAAIGEERINREKFTRGIKIFPKKIFI